MDDKRLDRIESKVDKVHDSIASIDSTLASQHISLKEHIRRTEILEAEVRPIKDHVAFMQAILRLVSVLAASVGVAVAFKSLIG